MGLFSGRQSLQHRMPVSQRWLAFFVGIHAKAFSGGFAEVYPSDPRQREQTIRGATSKTRDQLQEPHPPCPADTLRQDARKALSEIKKAFQIDDLEGFYQWLVGRRDWTRTNDPHHVKVVL